MRCIYIIDLCMGNIRKKNEQRKKYVYIETTQNVNAIVSTKRRTTKKKNKKMFEKQNELLH